MSPSRRAPMDPSFPGWDPDPLHVDDDPDPRVPSFGWEHRRRPRPDGAPGPAIVLAIVGIPLLALIVFAIVWAASRSGQTTDPVDVSGTSSAAQSSAPRIVNRRRRQSQAKNRMELYASARQVDSVAAQLMMLSEDDCLTDAEHDELEDLGQACRRVALDLFKRAGHA